MYIVHLSNPTRQVRVDANSVSVMDGFVTFSMRTHPEDYAPATVAVFRAEDVGAVYNQDNIESVINLPNVGSANRIPFETTQRVDPPADYAPAVLRQGSSSAQNIAGPLSRALTGNRFTASWENPIPAREPADSLRAYPVVDEEIMVFNDAGDLMPTAEDASPSPEVLNRAGMPISFADRISRNSLMPTRLPEIPRPTREPYGVDANAMATTALYGIGSIQPTGDTF